MSDTHGRASGREFWWFAALLIVMLVADAARLPGPAA
jgi:uncharacterized membrane protein YhaH (DUF805 family)